MDKRLITILLISTFLSFCNIQKGHFWGGDFAMYLEQANALVEGNMDELISKNQITIDRSDTVIGPYMYPMGYPILLAPILSLVGNNFVILKLYNLLFFLGSILLFYFLLKRFSVSKWVFWTSLLLFAINYQMIYFADRLASEFPFIFFSFLALLLIGRDAKSKLLNATLIGLVIFIAAIIRTTGIILLPTLLIFQLSKWYVDKFKITPKVVLSMIIPYVIFGIFWLVYGALFIAVDGKYLSLFEISISSVLRTIQFYIFQCIQMLVYAKPLGDVVLVCLSFLFVPIFLLGIKKLLSLKNVYLFGFCAMLLVLHIIYPITSIRFSLPLTPFVVLTTLVGVTTILKKLEFKINFDLAKFFFIMLIGISFIQTIASIYIQNKKGTNESYTSEMREIYDYIDEHVPDKELVIFKKPRVLRYFSGNNAFFTNDFSIENIGDVKYLLLNNEVEHIPNFEKHKSWNDFQLWKRNNSLEY